MEYKDALREQMEKYYDISGDYREATVLAMQDARKLGLFKKRDYRPHIERFSRIIENLRKLEYHSIEIPEEDKDAVSFVDLLDRSVVSFIMLCEENMKFYELTDKKQYRGSGVTVQLYAEQTQKMQEALSRAVEETSYLEQAYKEYFSGDFAD